ncbi:hypothetical protein WICPIJ_001681 [Wickerhamomyces pijperi]|uniref:Transcription elongation factor n=1 Tax=Wickerhamomyces pijperi TaxID=599730 RepID=A0A9P8QB51_WICPI|nr:hypothetical protein WICPIJ_001681 [Wickerhamomyces pijperi]
MQIKEIKTCISDLEKAKSEAQILEILKVLKRDLKPTEKLLRETKVGIAVNKFKSSKNKEITELVKTIINSWREQVAKEKKQKSTTPPAKASSASSTSTTTSSSATDISSTFNSENRSADSDGVKTSIYENQVRNSIIKALYNGLCIESQFPPNQLLKISKDIETEAFKVEKFDASSNYTKRMRMLISNIRQKNNPELRYKLSSGDLEAGKFVVMTAKDLAPESLKKELEKIKEQNLFNAQGASLERAVTDRFTCGKCKEKKVSYYQLQTRSADEPLTTFCTCENCGNRWKFS